jgi:hypothetical protein
MSSEWMERQVDTWTEIWKQTERQTDVHQTNRPRDEQTER